MARYYLPPEELAQVPIDGLSPEEAAKAIDEAVEKARVENATQKAAAILRQADVEVDEATVIRLRRLVK